MNLINFTAEVTNSVNSISNVFDIKNNNWKINNNEQENHIDQIYQQFLKSQEKYNDLNNSPPPKNKIRHSKKRKKLINNETVKIWHGDIVANFSQYPFMSAILLPQDKQKINLYSDFYCGATFITKKLLLTAAHCISNFTGGKLDILNPDSLFIANGGINLKHKNDFKIFAVKNIYRPDNFLLPPKLNNDLGIIEIYNDQQEIKTVDLVNDQNKAKLMHDGKNVRSIGWGITGPQMHISSRLRYGDQPIQSKKQSIHHLNKQCPSISNMYNPAQMIATWGGSFHHVYHGDSGGPLLSYDFEKNKYTQIGITSWGTDCHPKEKISHLICFFTRLDNGNFSNWIENIINNTESQLPAMEEKTFLNKDLIADINNSSMNDNKINNSKWSCTIS